MSKSKNPYIACGCCGKGLAANFLKARDPIWERCPDCKKIHGPEVHNGKTNAITSQPSAAPVYHLVGMPNV